MTSTLPKSRIIFILAGLVLLLAVPLTVFVAQQQQKTKQHASFTNPASNFSSLTKDYQQLIAEKAIDPAREILEVSLSYDESKDPQLAFTALTVKNGYVHYASQEGNYTLQVLDKNNIVLYSLKFDIPNEIHVDNFSSNPTKIASNLTILKQMKFTYTLPFYPTGSKIKLIDVQKHDVAIQSLTGVSRANNKPNFKSINGRDILNLDKSKKINLKDFLTNKAFAQSEEKHPISIVVLGNNYATAENFDEDFQRFVQPVFTFEPFKTRASQINFIPVNSTKDLSCRNPIDIYWCDMERITQQLNDIGIPYDTVMIVNNDPTWGGVAGISSHVGYMNSGSGHLTFVHELGHAFTSILSPRDFIWDEYYQYPSAGPSWIGLAPRFLGNCYFGTPPASGWKNLVGSEDYRKTCTFGDMYSSSQRSIMYDLSPYFNAVSQTIIDKTIDKIAGNFVFNDTVSPIVKITSPKEGADISGIFTISVDVADNNGIKYTQLWKDGLFIKTSYLSPFTFYWNTYLEIPGKHSIQIKAYDGAGNLGESFTVNVKVTEAVPNCSVSFKWGGYYSDVLKKEKAILPYVIKAYISDPDKALRVSSYEDDLPFQEFTVFDSSETSHRFINVFPGRYTGMICMQNESGLPCFYMSEEVAQCSFPTLVPVGPTLAPTSAPTLTPSTQSIYGQCLKLCDQGTLIYQNFDKTACVQECDSKYKQPSSTITTLTSTPVPQKFVGYEVVEDESPTSVSKPSIAVSFPIPTPTVSVDLHSLGDADGNGKINYGDLSKWANEVTQGTIKTADFDGNGIVNTDDYNIWRDSMNNPNLPH